MSLYIVRPRETLATRAVGLISKQFAPERRQEQIAEVLSLRNEDPIYSDLKRWMADSPKEVKPLTDEASSSVTGTRIVSMSEEEAERLRREMPDVLVLRDQPMELIRPAKAAAVSKAKVTAKDLWHLKAIGLEAARKRGFKGTGKGIVVAVLDTGVDASHPELDGRVQAAYTFDVLNDKVEPMDPSRDTDGHGTHVAGLICGKKVGVAPEAKVINAVMIPKGRGNLSDFIIAIEWAARQENVQIVNMSAGIPGYLPEMLTAVANLLTVGVLPVFATGNEGRNKTRSPGNYAEPFSVGAANESGRVSSFSSGGVIVADNHRYEVPDLVAPGEAVYSCVIGGGYEAWDGTSMATPVVSGVAALMLEKFPKIRVPDLVEELLTTCKNLGQDGDRQGKGLIQVKAVG